jgi:hypothetical protein
LLTEEAMADEELDDLLERLEELLSDIQATR